MRRSAPADISGKVAPRSIDCGRISSAAIPHLAIVRLTEPAVAGKTELYAQPVTPT